MICSQLEKGCVWVFKLASSRGGGECASGHGDRDQLELGVRCEVMNADVGLCPPVSLMVQWPEVAARTTCLRWLKQ
jgi:hypothetical protein